MRLAFFLWPSFFRASDSNTATTCTLSASARFRCSCCELTSDAMILEYAFSNVLIAFRRRGETTVDGGCWGEGSPLQERLLVPRLKRLIAYHGPRHLLVLPVDGLLREARQSRRIVAFKSRTLAVQLSDLTGGSLARKRLG